MRQFRTVSADLRLAMAAPRPAGRFESRWTTVRSVELHDRMSVRPGTGRLPIVLVHGLAVSHRYLMPLADRLAPRHPVRVVDLPGFGLSGDPGEILDLHTLADWLAEWLVVTGDSPVALAGNSFGCQVAVEVALRHPKLVNALVLVGPTMDPGARTAARQIARWVMNLRHEDPLQGVVLLRDLADAGVRRAVGTFRIALRDVIEDKLPAIRIPALVTRGGLEPVVSQGWVEQACGLLAQAELAVIPKSPHNANYTAADRLAPVILTFLDRVNPSAPGR